MRKLILTATLVAAAAGMTAMSAPAQAREIGWCARTSSTGYANDCMYYTYDQCRAAVSGLRGGCYRNPFASYGYEQERPRRHRRHANY